MAASPGAGPASDSPAAMRSCSSTRSSPVTASVTGCSTWIRPFSSRKKHLVAVDEELGRSGALVSDRAANATARGREPRAPFGREAGRRCLLDDLLVAALDGAVAQAERDDVPVRRPISCTSTWRGPLEVALAEDGAVAEGGLGLARGGGERLLELLRRVDDAHPAAAAAGGRLDEEGEAELLRTSPVSSIGTPAPRGDPLRLQLVAAEPERRPADGPIQVRPAASTASANAALSARKP